MQMYANHMQIAHWRLILWLECGSGSRWGAIPGTRGAPHACLWRWGWGRGRPGADRGEQLRAARPLPPAAALAAPHRPLLSQGAGRMSGDESRPQWGLREPRPRRGPWRDWEKPRWQPGSPSRPDPPRQAPELHSPPRLPGPCSHPEQGAAERCCFVCFLHGCLLPSPASSAQPP